MSDQTSLGDDPKYQVIAKGPTPLPVPRYDRAFDLLLKSMNLAASINPASVEHFKALFKLAAVAAEIDGTPNTGKLIVQALKEFEAHLATLPHRPAG